MAEKNTKNTTEELGLIDIQWDGPEFEMHEKGISWFITIGTIALIIFTISLLMKNFIFSFLIVLSVFAIFVYALKSPKIVKFKIDRNGLTIDEKSYPYEDLKSFWIFYEPPRLNELSIKSKKWLLGTIDIPIPEADQIQIRNALIRFIPEEKREESFIDAMARHLKF